MRPRSALALLAALLAALLGAPPASAGDPELAGKIAGSNLCAPLLRLIEATGTDFEQVSGEQDWGRTSDLWIRPATVGLYPDGLAQVHLFQSADNSFGFPPGTLAYTAGFPDSLGPGEKGGKRFRPEEVPGEYREAWNELMSATSACLPEGWAATPEDTSQPKAFPLRRAFEDTSSGLTVEVVVRASVDHHTLRLLVVKRPGTGQAVPVAQPSAAPAPAATVAHPSFCAQLQTLVDQLGTDFASYRVLRDEKNLFLFPTWLASGVLPGSEGAWVEDWNGVWVMRQVFYDGREEAAAAAAFARTQAEIDACGFGWERERADGEGLSSRSTSWREPHTSGQRYRIVALRQHDFINEGISAFGTQMQSSYKVDLQLSWMIAD
ncbi:MAG: hypothetical protein ABIO70_01210 [Pseudomonadota bacterium]